MNKRKLLITCLAALGWLGLLLWGLTGAVPAQPAWAQEERILGTADEELVFLDSTGFIRVLDPNQVARTNEILWVSPDGGWRDIALGDFNGDGDAEIAAVGGEGKDAKLAIYDPVVADVTAVKVNQITNEIPWDRLYFTSTISSTLAVGKPMRIAAGHFSDSPGDELVISLALADGEVTNSGSVDYKGSQLLIWQRQTTVTTTQSWQPRIQPVGFDEMWSAIVVGDIDNRDVWELVLLDDNDGVMRVYRLDGNQLTQLYDYESNDRPWLAAAIGQVYTGGFGELVAVRRSPQGLPSMIVFRYLATPDNGQLFKDQLTDFFNPPATQVFLANINGTVTVTDDGELIAVNDDEIFMLRDLPARPANAPVIPHLFLRNPGEDKKDIAVFEVFLDADNGYRAGLAAEVNGDTREEVVVMRNNRLRIYLAPKSGPASFQDYPVNSDGKTLRAGNLDARGYPKLPKIVVKPNQLAQTMATGDKREVVITVTNEGNIDSIPFSLYFGGDSSWLRAVPPQGQTPAQITIHYDAYGLPPVADFRAFLAVSPNHARVPAKDVTVPIALRTTPGLWPSPDRVVALIDCNTRAPQALSVRVAGLQGVFYNASITDLGAAIQSAATAPADLTATEPYTVPFEILQVPWISSLTGLGRILPTTLTVTFNPGPDLVPGTQFEAVLGVYATNNQGQESNIAIPVVMACYQESYYLPWIDR